MTDAITIQGVPVEVQERYKEGDTLKENEAAALNQTLRENVRNNCASHVREAKENVARANGWFKEDDETPDVTNVTVDHLDMESIQAFIDKYASEYEFGARTGGGGRTADPVIREARTIAMDLVKNAIRDKGANISSYETKELNKLRDQVLEKHNDQIMARAKERVAAAQSINVDDIDL